MKKDILNIADNLSILKKNYENYVEIRDKDDFDSYIKKKDLYNNWVVTLSNFYNSLLKYYEEDTSEYWEKIKVHISKIYKYENTEIEFKSLLKKYRNKKIHSENPNSLENNLLPIIVVDSELEELQKLIIDTINYELGRIDKYEIITHTIKSGSNIIYYKKLKNSICESMNKATNEERKMLEIPYSIIQEVLNILIDDTLLSEEVFGEIEKKLDNANSIIHSKEYINYLLLQPYGREILEFLDKINKTENLRDFYNFCLDFKKNFNS